METMTEKFDITFNFTRETLKEALMVACKCSLEGIPRDGIKGYKITKVVDEKYKETDEDQLVLVKYGSEGEYIPFPTGLSIETVANIVFEWLSGDRGTGSIGANINMSGCYGGDIVAIRAVNIYYGK